MTYYGLDHVFDGSFELHPGDRFTTRIRPAPFEKNGVLMPSRFEKHAFDKQIGKTVPLIFKDELPPMGAKVLAVTVAPDGTYADLEYEVV